MTEKETRKLISRRMLAQHFFQVHFALTSKDISAFFDRWSNQQSENKACNLSMRLAEPPRFTNMLLLEEECEVHDKVGLRYLHSFSKLSYSLPQLCHKSLVSSSFIQVFFSLSCSIHSFSLYNTIFVKG